MQIKHVHVVLSGFALLATAGLGQAAQRETTAEPLSQKELKRKQARFNKESTAYRNWITQDVAYIITDDERRAWNGLGNDEEREQFIEQFWLRRDPTPDTEENEFKEEHYRRIAYANEHFASGIPGWKTDRGHIYIVFGPPDEIEPHPSGGSYDRPIEEGGGTTQTFPFEVWRYRHIEGVKTGVVIEFVDPTMTGEYRMTMNPNEKDALVHVPNAGLTWAEQNGSANKGDRITNPFGNNLLLGGRNQFDALKQYADLLRAPKVRETEPLVNSSIRYNVLPMQVRAHYIPLLGDTCLTNITVQFAKRDLQFQEKDGVAKSAIEIHARITSLARRRVNGFDDTIAIDVPAAMLQQAMTGASLYQKSVPLAPGAYRLQIVAKDLVGGNLNNFEMALEVPRLEEEKLGASSLILADLIEKVATGSVGTGQFVIGGTKVRPRVASAFRTDEKLGFYVKLYHFAPDRRTQKPDGTVEYEIVRGGSGETVAGYSGIEVVSATQVTIEKLVSLQGFTPGQYTLRVRARDRLRNQSVTSAADFTVLAADR